MTSIALILRAITGRSAAERRAQVAAARRRADALLRVRDAESRGDTRDYGRALEAARKATTNALKLEIGR